jgi:hypothetical protein
MHRDAADPAALLNDEDGAAELRSLDGGTAVGGTAADDDEVEGVHGREGWRKAGRSVYRLCAMQTANRLPDSCTAPRDALRDRQRNARLFPMKVMYGSTAMRDDTTEYA